MKGVIFNAFEKFIVDAHGEDFFEDILSECQLQTEGIFVGPGTYPDTDLLEIVQKTIHKLNLPLDQALQAFGKFLFHELHAGNPKFADSCKSLKEFLRSVDGIIHVEVNKLYPEARTPKFTYQEPSAQTLEITYSSARNLPDLFEGLVQGAADHFQTSIQILRTPLDAQAGVWKFTIHFVEMTPA
ncbi:MAG: heme NO-binding domain-containing protein [Zetaproteobacteria bacterium]|nr:heme NO-binding domain-containing protein [Zetaproteobacteria bacterium]